MAKLVSLIIAVGIWSFAVSGATRTDVFPATIPITVEHVPADLAATLSADSVNVRISAEEAVWRQLQSRSFSATVDLSGLTAGITEVPVQVLVLVPNVQLVEVLPRTVVVQLESITSRTTPVQIQTQGVPATGFFPSDASSDPQTVTVRGATSLIDRLDRVSGVIDVSGATSDRDDTVTLQAVDSAGRQLIGLTISPKTVKVHQQLTRLAATKTVGVRVITAGTPIDGKVISPIVTKPLTITIAGSQQQLANITALSTKPIDIAKLSQPATLKASLDVPNGITVTNGDAQNIEVTFDVSNQDVVRTIAAPLVFSGLSNDRHVVTADPATATVVVRGPASAIQDLKPGDVSLTLDLSGAVPGDRSVSLVATQVTVPNNVSLQQLITTQITVKIE